VMRNLSTMESTTSGVSSESKKDYKSFAEAHGRAEFPETNYRVLQVTAVVVDPAPSWGPERVVLGVEGVLSGGVLSVSRLPHRIM